MLLLHVSAIEYDALQKGTCYTKIIQRVGKWKLLNTRVVPKVMSNNFFVKYHALLLKNQIHHLNLHNFLYFST